MEEVVTRGAALLDRVVPGWYTLVNVPQLEMASCSACVLGQLFGDYEIGLVRLHVEVPTHDDPLGPLAFRFVYGFSLCSNPSPPDRAAWDQLLDLWVAAVTTRLAHYARDAAKTEDRELVYA